MEIILALAVFFLIIIVLETGYSLVRGGNTRSAHSVVKKYTSSVEKNGQVDILYYRKFSDIKIFHNLLAMVSAVRKLDGLMQQGGVKMLAGVFLLATAIFSGISFLLVSLFINRVEVAVVAAMLSLVIPYFGLLAKRNKRRVEFEALFPDALDLMCYSLKAGHSILASLKMVSEEMADPVAEEFGYVVDEINFGKSVDSTLRNFARRVDSAELRYFVTSVIIQRDTGGNLVEILTKISEVIRKKFRFRERVKALVAEGKLSAIILVALPFLVGGYVSLTNMKYLMVLTTDPVGLYLIVGASVMMFIGIVVMYKLVQLDM